MRLPLCRCLALAAATALAACRPPVPPVESPAAPVTPEEQAAQEQRYEELAARLAPEGAEALAGLSTSPDPGHGAVYYQGRVPGTGSTAYLRLVQLGSGGARAVRLVLRYEGSDWLDVGECSLVIDGRTVGAFRPQKVRAERTGDGVAELLDADADTLRPVLTSLLESDSAEIRMRGTKGEAVIRLDDAQLSEMRKVMAAYLHLQSGAP